MTPEEKERMKNFLMWKVYMTDKEIEESSPALIILGVFAIIVILISCSISSCQEKTIDTKQQTGVVA